MTTSPIAERVAAEVRGHMARTRRTQFDLAELLDCSQTAISRRLKGTIAFDVDELVRVAQFLGVPAAALLPEPEAVPAMTAAPPPARSSDSPSRLASNATSPRTTCAAATSPDCSTQE